MRGKKNLLHCAPSLSPRAELWAMEAPVGALVHKTTYGLLIDKALYLMLLCGQIHYLGKLEGGGPSKSQHFGPQMTLD